MGNSQQRASRCQLLQDRPQLERVASPQTTPFPGQFASSRARHMHNYQAILSQHKQSFLLIVILFLCLRFLTPSEVLFEFQVCGKALNHSLIPLNYFKDVSVQKRIILKIFHCVSVPLLINSVHSPLMGSFST